MLLRLEVENFKSYYGYQTLGPFLQFTAVIGPNGAGKSNLMDAISFVLGVRAQHLRAEKAKTLINGYNTSHAAKKAYVRAVYKAEEDDDEVQFYRSVNAKGESEYRINDRVVSQEQYIKRLASIHILSKARNFLVFQGDVENIAAMDPKALTKLFEQISGSGGLQKEYEEALKKKDAAEEELKDFHSRRKGIMAEKKQFQEQQEEASRFQELEKKRAKYQHDHHLYQLYIAEQCIAALTAEIAELEAEERRHEQRVVQIETQAAAKRKEHAKEAKQLVKLEDEAKRKHNEIRALRPKQIKLEEQIKHARDKLEAARTALSRAKYTHTKKDDTIKELEAELKTTQRRMAEFEVRAKDARGSGVQLGEAQLEEYTALKTQAAAETAEKQAALDQATRTRNNLRDQLQRLHAQANAAELAITQAKERIATLAEREHKLEAQLKTYAATVAEDQAKVDRLERQKADDDNLDKIKREELAKVQAQLSEARADKHESERERKAGETYEALKGLFPGVKGRLLELCDVTHKRYNTAVTVVMGKNMNAIVVDKDETARACMNYLKEQKAGTETFLPLQSIEAKPINDRLRSLGGTKKPVADVLRYPREIQAAVEYACGNSVVCDTLEEAKQLCFHNGDGKRYKCVTLDGTLIRKSGVMTGGAGIEAQASKWDGRAVEDLRRQRVRLQKELEDLAKRKGPREREISDYASQVRGVQGKIRSMELDLSVTRAGLQDKRLAMKGHQAELDKIDLDGVTRQLEQAQAAVDELEGEKNKVVDKVFKAFCKRIGINNIREYEGKELREAQERQREKIEMQTHEAKIRSQIEYQRTRDTKGPVDKAERDVETQEGQLGELEESLAAVGAEVEKGEAQVKALKDQAAQAKKLVDERDIAVKELKQTLTAEQEALGDVRKRAGTLRVDGEQLRSKRHSLLQTCRFDKIDIALVGGGSLLDLDWEGGAGAMGDSMETQEREAAHAREDAVRIDYSKLKPDLRDATGAADVQAVNEQFEAKLKEIENQMENMAPNMKASGKLDTVRDKLNKVGSEFAAAQARAQEADKEFRAVQRQRHELFTKAFEHVAHVIDPIYKELTKNPNLGATAVGGTAYLTLENAEEPYLHGVKYNTMPPSKRFRDMEQLSGGEKTVAALALLFAIHDYRPSPFFVLDEIDAALDKTNVQKIANYIQNSSKKFQCIVISLKDSFYSKADGIVGIYRDKAHQSSRSLTLDLRPFDNKQSRAIPAR